MNIDFSLVDGLASEVFMHRLHWNSLVVDVRPITDKEAINFARNRLQKCRTATTRSTKDHKHLSTLDQAIKIPQNLNLRLSLLANESFEQTGSFQRIIT